MQRREVTFPNADGLRLSALLETPDTGAKTYALFAHCFTCGKDLRAASRISRALVARGIGVLRFDFTGLGNSEGDFANTSFSSNVQDLIAAVAHMRTSELAPPEILIGHSLGGAAMLAAAPEVPEARAVVTIGAPADPKHVTALIASDLERIKTDGAATVDLAGRRFEIRRQFLDDLDEHRMQDYLRRMTQALLIFHAPEDEIVDIDNARRLFVAAKHPKSFIALDGGDHLLTTARDSEFVAHALTAWASRYTSAAATEPGPTKAIPAGQVEVETRSGKFSQTVTAGRHTFVADEPLSVGGEDAGPGPYDLLLAALGTCTAMTLQMYAARKGLPLDRVRVRLEHGRMHARDCEECEQTEGQVERISRQIEVQGDLDEAQRQRLLEIADKCPVHRTLHRHPTVASSLVK